MSKSGGRYTLASQLQIMGDVSPSLPQVLRLWMQEFTEVPLQERQSDGTECKKNFQRPGLRPGPRCRGELTALPRSPSGWGGRLAAPSPTTSAVGPLDLASPVPYSDIVPHLIQAGDAPESHIGYD